MHKATSYTQDGKKTGEFDLPDSVFGVKVKEGPLYYAIKGYLANARRGTASTKTKADVAYGGAKPWRQKGTGRARVGTRGSPIWVGGGVAMGPKPRDYSSPVPKKVRHIALKSALTSLASEGKVLVIEDLEIEKPRTKTLVELMEKLEIPCDFRCLILIHKKNDNVKLSARNLPNVVLKMAKDLNALDVMKCGCLLATRKSMAQLEEVLQK